MPLDDDELDAAADTSPDCGVGAWREGEMKRRSVMRMGGNIVAGDVDGD